MGWGGASVLPGVLLSDVSVVLSLCWHISVKGSLFSCLRVTFSSHDNTERSTPPPPPPPRRPFLFSGGELEGRSARSHVGLFGRVVMLSAIRSTPPGKSIHSTRLNHSLAEKILVVQRLSCADSYAARF